MSSTKDGLFEIQPNQKGASKNINAVLGHIQLLVCFIIFYIGSINKRYLHNKEYGKHNEELNSYYVNMVIALTDWMLLICFIIVILVAYTTIVLNSITCRNINSNLNPDVLTKNKNGKIFLYIASIFTIKSLLSQLWRLNGYSHLNNGILSIEPTMISNYSIMSIIMFISIKIPRSIIIIGFVLPIGMVIMAFNVSKNYIYPISGNYVVQNAIKGIIFFFMESRASMALSVLLLVTYLSSFYVYINSFKSMSTKDFNSYIINHVISFWIIVTAISNIYIISIFAGKKIG